MNIKNLPLSLKSLVNEPPSKFPRGALLERDACPQGLLYITFKVPCKGAPLQVPLTELP
jgi:hypothetical protein